ncbi:MAG: ATP phosphoribosyltransferase regulatory subunit [Oscillospiraceae bacterium]|nr:ATP phosphoribosyltransferase regulatory subunit [Oscillospiraceae bacterium]
MRGRSDEIHQMGIELIGSDSKRADLEVISSAIEVLASFENEDFRFELGDIGFFRELVNKLDADTAAKEEIRSLIEVKNYPALNDLLDSIGDNDITKALKQLPRLFGGEEVFDKAAELYNDEKIGSVISGLRDLYNRLIELGYGGKITIDLGIVNKLDYYTGVVMKGYLQGYGDAVLSGGRYNKLLAEFGYDVPATGFAVNVDAVAKVMKQSHTYSAPVPDVIVYGADGFVMEAIKYANDLRGKGLVVENSVFDSYDETKAYAAKKGIVKTVHIGETVTEENINGGRLNG